MVSTVLFKQHDIVEHSLQWSHDHDMVIMQASASIFMNAFFANYFDITLKCIYRILDWCSRGYTFSSTVPT